MNNKSLKPALIFFLCSVVMATNARAVSVYDGIYNTTPDIGYVIFREQNGSMVGVLNRTYPALEWEAFQGPLISNTVRLSSIIGHGNIVINVTFPSTATFRATQISCIPDPGSFCLFTNGATFTGLKIW